MNYYKLTKSSNLNEVGVVPQSEETHVGDIQKQFIPWEGRIDFEFLLPEPKLERKAKQTSLLNVVAIPARFLVIDDTLLTVLIKLDIGKYQYWKLKTWEGKELVDQYNLFFLNNSKQSEYIDFKKSEFLIGKLGDWKDVSIREAIQIENYEEYIKLKSDLRKTKDKKRLREKKIVYDLSKVNEDMFRIMNIPYVGYYISEKLKNAIQENGCTGIEFMEIGELDKVEVIY